MIAHLLVVGAVSVWPAHLLVVGAVSVWPARVGPSMRKIESTGLTLTGASVEAGRNATVSTVDFVKRRNASVSVTNHFEGRRLTVEGDYATFFYGHPDSLRWCWYFWTCDTCTTYSVGPIIYNHVWLVEMPETSDVLHTAVFVTSGADCSTGEAPYYATFDYYQDAGVNLFGLAPTLDGIEYEVFRYPDDPDQPVSAFFHDAVDYTTCSFFALNSAGGRWDIIDLTFDQIGYGSLDCLSYEPMVTIGVECDGETAQTDVFPPDVCRGASYYYAAWGSKYDPSYPLILRTIPGAWCGDGADACGTSPRPIYDMPYGVDPEDDPSWETPSGAGCGLMDPDTCSNTYGTDGRDDWRSAFEACPVTCESGDLVTAVGCPDGSQVLLTHDEYLSAYVAPDWTCEANATNSDTYCDDPAHRCLPGWDAIGRGFDAITNQRRGRVLDVSFGSQHVVQVNAQNYDAPGELDVQQINTDTETTVSSIYRRVTEYTQHVAASLSVTTVAWKMLVNLGADVSAEFASGFEEASYSYQSERNRIFAKYRYLSDTRTCQLSFEDAVASLPESVDQDSYLGRFLPFIQNYGTHVIVEADVGARLEYDEQVDTCEYKESFSLDTDFTASLTRSFNQAVGISTSYDTDETETTFFNIQRTSMTIMGGDLERFSESGWVAWLDTFFDADDHEPGVYNFQLIPIWRVVADERRRSAIYEALRRYSTQQAQDQHDIVCANAEPCGDDKDKNAAFDTFGSGTLFFSALVLAASVTIPFL